LTFIATEIGFHPIPLHVHETATQTDILWQRQNDGITDLRLGHNGNGMLETKRQL